MSNPLESLARRVGDHPFFLAAVLARYAGAEGLDDAGLAGALGCDRDALPDLRLCRAPRRETFRADVECIATRFGLDAGRLAGVVRYGQALQQMAGERAARGMLLAGRDRGRAGDTGPPAGGRP
jgi:hypothetical protein